jgi:hypothetical protein
VTTTDLLFFAGEALVAALVIRRYREFFSKARALAGDRDRHALAHLTARSAVLTPLFAWAATLSVILCLFMIRTESQTIYLGPLIDLAQNLWLLVGLPLGILWVLTAALLWQSPTAWMRELRRFPIREEG